jgi:probable rRNA maturation factor
MIIFLGNSRNINRITKQKTRAAEEYLRLVLSIKETSMSILFASDKYMLNLNRTTRGIDKVTDVLSYPNTDQCIYKNAAEILPTLMDGDTVNAYIGDIVISTEQAKIQAKENERTRDDEIIHLAIHGILHLYGYDHISESDYKIMQRMEKTLIKKANVENEQ